MLISFGVYLVHMLGGRKNLKEQVFGFEKASIEDYFRAYTRVLISFCVCAGWIKMFQEKKILM